MATDVDPAELCRLYGSSILRRACAILNNVPEAEDASQEVMVMVMTKSHQFRRLADVGTWIYRITTNVCLNRLREHRRRSTREQREEVVSWVDLAPASPYEHVEARSQLRRILNEHDDLSQQVFVYKYLDGLTQEEIAAATGKSRRTVGKRIQQLELSVKRYGEATA